MGSGSTRHVLIAGAGAAGLEAMLALAALAEGRVEVELLAPTDEFVYRPMLTAEPFETAEVLRLDLQRIVADAGARHTKAALASVDPGARRIETAHGSTIEYDALLVAVGARPVEAVPGALTFSGEAERRRFAEVLAALGRRGTRRLAFVVPRQATWSIAAYEPALLTAAERDARRLRGVEITLVTHESEPLDLFGAAASQLVAARLDEAQVALRPASVAKSFRDRELELDGEAALAADAVVALPALEVPPIPGLPQRKGGFVQTDVRMQVVGLESVWVAGDATWFPIKQGGLAAQQADVAARTIGRGRGSCSGRAVSTGAARCPDNRRSPRVPALASRPSRWRVRSPGKPPVVASRQAGRQVSGAVSCGEIGEAALPELVDLEPPTEPARDQAEHEDAIRLVLAAADADARMGDFEGALKWLSLVEELNSSFLPITWPAATSGGGE